MSLRPPIPTIAALSLAVLTAAAATAAAPGASGQIKPGSGKQGTATWPLAARSRPELTSDSRRGPLSVAPVVLQVTTPRAGFDWGDAGIGAAAALGLSMIALAAALAISQRRTRCTSQNTGGMS